MEFALEKILGVQAKEQEQQKLERYEEKNKLKKKLYKLVNNLEAKQMAREQFAALAHIKENQIAESIILTKANIMDYMIECLKHPASSKIIENIADYVIKAIPKASFKEYFKFLAEGLISTSPFIQRQICYSVYASCKEKLYLSEIYKYYDDPLWRIILDDLLLIYERLQKKAGESFANKVRTRADLQRELLAKLNVKCKNHGKKREHSFLFVESSLTDTLDPFYDEAKEATHDEEVKAILGQKDPFLTFEEFNEITFTEENAPMLLFFIMHILCGEDLADYFAELAGINAFRYRQVQRNGFIEYLVERKRADHFENSIKRQNKEFVKKAQKSKPNARDDIIKFSIELFQGLRIGAVQEPDMINGILREQFINNSAVSIFKM